MSETDSEPERADEEGVSDPRRGAHLIARAGVVLLAFALRVLYVREVWPHPSIQLPVIDALAYRDRALEILAGDWLGGAVYYLDPLYPFFLAFVYVFVPPDSIGVLVAQALLDSASVVLIALLAGRVFDARTALVAGVLAATYRPFMYYDAMLLKAPLMIFLIVLALYLVVRAASGDRPRVWLAAGFLLGLAALTRSWCRERSGPTSRARSSFPGRAARPSAWDRPSTKPTRPSARPSMRSPTPWLRTLSVRCGRCSSPSPRATPRRC